MASTASADTHTTITDAQWHPHTAKPTGRYLTVLSLTALGIAPTPGNVFGVMSLGGSQIGI